MKANLNRTVLLCILVIMTSTAYLLANDYNNRMQIANRINAKYGIKLNLYRMSLDNMLAYEKARDDLEMEVNILRINTLYMLKKREALIEQRKIIGSERPLLYNHNIHNTYDRTYNNTAININKVLPERVWVPTIYSG